MTDHEQYRDLESDYRALADSATATGAPDVALYWQTRAHSARTQAERARPPAPPPPCPHGLANPLTCATCRAQFGGGR